MIFAVATLSSLDQDTGDTKNICPLPSQGWSVAEQVLYSAGVQPPSPEETKIAEALYVERIKTSQWRKLDFQSESAQGYRIACAIVGDRSDALERLLHTEFQIKTGKRAPPTPVRDVLRKLLLGTSTDGSVEIWARPLRFYPHRELVEFRFTTATGVFPLRFVCVDRAYWDVTPVIAVPMTRSSPPIHEINAFQSRAAADLQFLDVAATDGRVEDYIKFFCAHVGSEDGYFQVVENRKDFLQQTGDELPDADAIYGPNGEAVFIWLNDSAVKAITGSEGQEPESKSKPVSLDTLMPMITPITRVGRAAEGEDEDDASAFFAATLIHADVFYDAVLRVSGSGMVEMMNDIARFDSRPLPLMAVRDPRRAQEMLRRAVGPGN
jgi:hypothetical protein